jgi:NAD(P)-dependent dehydrogenase (short-subunit alcohol dehydrogenase family)
MVLHAAASLASAVLPAGALGFVTDHPRFESVAARLGVRADSPLAALLATALLVFPAAVAMSASRAVGARGRRERQRANDENNKVVLVTGASGGLGALIVDRLREAFPNAAVYGTSRSGVEPIDARTNANASESFARTNAKRQPPPLLRLDITDEQSVKRLMDHIESTHGRLDLLVNNAGSVVATHAASTSDEDARDQFGTNFFGAVRVARLATRVMRHGRERRVKRANDSSGTSFVAGRIVNVGSIGGRIGLPFQSMYSASKAATMTWSDALRIELASEAIFVSLIEPGDLKPGMVNARKAEGFDADPVAKRATYIMRAEEAVGTDPKVVAAVVERIAKSAKPKGRYLVGPDAWLVEALGRLVPHAWKEYFLASHYRVPPRENAWIRV